MGFSDLRWPSLKIVGFILIAGLVRHFVIPFADGEHRSMIWQLFSAVMFWSGVVFWVGLVAACIMDVMTAVELAEGKREERLTKYTKYIKTLLRD